jgi:K+/H+ antiporter YhaU regulatory subunit KhtT
VGIERSGERLLNPESSVTLQSGDVLWIVGNPKRILVFEKTMAKGHDHESDTVLVAG